MSKLTLDEAIKEFADWAKDNRKEQNYWAAERNESYDEANPLSYADCEGFARDAEARAEYHEQLAEWLKELKETKRLLKAAVEDFAKLDRENAKNKNCMMPEMDCADCPLSWDSVDDRVEPCHSWRYANEALKLLNDEK